MEPVAETTRLITEFGVLAVIAGVFIVEKVFYLRTIGKTLNELSSVVRVQGVTLEGLNNAISSMKASADNTATALNIISITLTNIIHAIERHDNLTKFMNTDLREAMTLLRLRPCLVECKTGITMTPEVKAEQRSNLL